MPADGDGAAHPGRVSVEVSQLGEVTPLSGAGSPTASRYKTPFLLPSPGLGGASDASSAAVPLERSGM